MKNDDLKRTVIITAVICLVPIIMGAILYSSLPDSMPIHWGSDGQPDNYASKAFALFGLPGIMLGLDLLLPFLMKTDPKYKNMSPALRKLCLWIMPAVSLISFIATVGVSKSIDIPVDRVVMAFMGIVFIVIGNYLPKTKQSYTMGIRLPWTLNSEENWNKTHRLGGYIWVIGGIIIFILSFIKLPFWVFISVVAVMTLVPTVYSYLLYRKASAEDAPEE